MPTKAELEDEISSLKTKLDMAQDKIEEQETRLDSGPTMSIHDTPEGRLRQFVDRCRTEFPVEQVGVLIRNGCQACSKAGKWKACDRHRWVSSGRCQVPNCAGNHANSAVHIDYIGHAEITARLLELDPQWDWEPVAFDPEGKPVMTKRESMVSLWIRLTINGITRLGVGTCSTAKEEIEKELIGDALRNAAMRFGIGLDLWSKSETLDGSFDREPPPQQPAPATEDGEQEERTDSAPEQEGGSEGESGAVAEEPARPSSSDQAVDRETVVNAFMGLRGQFAKDARFMLEDAGLWPVLDIPEDKLDEAAGLITPILERQNKEGK